MSEHPTPDRPSKPTKEAAWDAATEQELDDVLAKAASLASDLNQQLAAPDDHPVPSVPDPLDAPVEVLDHELSQLGFLVDTTAQQVAEPAEKGVPDFMSEFMAPATTSAPQSASAAEAASTATEPIPAPPHGIVGGPINIVIPSKSSKRASAVQVKVVEPEPIEAVGSDIRRGPFAWVTALLDVADRPFTWAGRGVRGAVGVIAVVVLLASILVFVLRSR